MQQKAGMLMWWKQWTAVSALLCLLPAMPSAQAPTLGELAKREQERRKAITAPTRVITNRDLPKPSTPAAPATTQAAPTLPAEVAAKPDSAKPDTEKVEKDEAWWRARITQVREELRRNQVFADALQSRVNALTTDFVNRDDPFQRAKIAEDRQKALAELERVKAEIEQGNRQIAEIEEEARQAGVPPGWIR